MEFQLIKTFEVENDGRVLELGGAKPRALLTSLLLRANAVVGRDMLIEELWSGAPPATAAHAIKIYVSRLQRVVPDHLQTRNSNYLLRAEPAEVDTVHLEALLDAARRARAAGDALQTVELVDAALRLWRSAPLSG